MALKDWTITILQKRAMLYKNKNNQVVIQILNLSKPLSSSDDYWDMAVSDKDGLLPSSIGKRGTRKQVFEFAREYMQAN